MTLLEDIRDGAIGNSAPLEEVLQRCLVLASKLRNEQLRSWATQELNGYEDDENLPAYRILTVGIRFDAISQRWKATKHPVPPGSFPPHLIEAARHVRLTQGVAHLEGWAREGDVRLSLPPAVYAEVGKNIVHGTLTNAWHDVHREQLLSLLSTIRTRIVEFTLTIEEEFPDFDQRGFSPNPILQAAVNHVINVTIMGTGNVINVGGGSGFVQNIQQQVNAGDLTSLGEFLRNQGIGEDELRGLDEVIAKSSPADTAVEGSPLRRWVDKAANSIAGGSKKLVKEAAKELILLSIRYYFGEITDAQVPSKSG